mmetsp:Transcript_41306/g.54294  ORF Transcript_41306/g.54294 Transcript_41306/m.54294 type:complete len:278 (+) Transcript_41306:25-858(+)|eukprot:CAMPEP_0117795912 /NCGR_PEP_ID=MMETSP0948-20121206/11599_1 /TAXON_ID=44440 /ORGANISM="Chattonella subsalsa, Strain CCMP2191" /LENGTH=277 /DNA_ID=CAMNT_0005626975 /DNA_START=27 /DNA_END=860 /DNA_ORIENTATION=-
MGAGASSTLTKEQEIQLFDKLHDVYQSEKPDKEFLSEEEKSQIFQALQNSFKDILADLNGGNDRKDKCPTPTENKPPPPCLPDFLKTLLEPKKEKGPSMVEKATAKLLGLSTKHTEFCVGDIIRGKPEGDVMFYEGVIVSINEEKTLFEVDFDGEIEQVRKENAQRVLAWNALENGDIVQAQPADERNYYNAMVVGINPNGTYQIMYEGEDDIEDNVPIERIRKLCSNRSDASRNWRKAFNKFQVTKALAGFGRKSSSYAEALDSSRKPSNTEATVN